MSKLYFPSLNGLRFFAALFVILHHVEQFKELLGMPNNSEIGFIKLIGKLGVLLFFVLSGFLITYLLFVEKQRTHTVAIRDFYIRRALRIWPLYFLIIVLAFFILPEISFFDIQGLSEKIGDGFWLKILLYLLFLPNLVLGLFPLIPYASQLWSIGYEEQFYLIWPWLIKWIKNIKYLFIGIVLAFLAVKFLAVCVFDDYLAQHHYDKVADVFFSMPSIDSMAIGAGFAYILYNKSRIMGFLFLKSTQLFLYGLLAFLIISGTFIPFFNNLVYSVLFGILILNLAANKQTVFTLEHKALDFLGKISYGMYMYHAIAIVLVLKGLSWLSITNIYLEYLLSILITVAVSSLSYHYFEEKFIRFKEKFAKV